MPHLTHKRRKQFLKLYIFIIKVIILGVNKPTSLHDETKAVLFL